MEDAGINLYWNIYSKRKAGKDHLVIWLHYGMQFMCLGLELNMRMQKQWVGMGKENLWGEGKGIYNCLLKKLWNLHYVSFQL